MPHHGHAPTRTSYFVLPGVPSVYLLRSSAQGLSALEAHLAERLAEQMSIQTGARPSPGEQRSWSRSIPQLRADLIDADLGGVEMLLEYQLPEKTLSRPSLRPPRSAPEALKRPDVDASISNLRNLYANHSVSCRWTLSSQTA